MSNARWDAWDAHDEAYAQRAQVRAAELLMACEILLYAGFTDEALSVLSCKAANTHEMRRLFTDAGTKERMRPWNGMMGYDHG